MLAIGIDTSVPRGSVALVAGEPESLVLTHHVPAAFSETLLAAIDRLLSDAGRAMSAIDLLAVSTGPGNFTGLRVGMATAKGLALALSRPLVGIPTLKAIAFECMTMPGLSPSAFCILQEAGRGEVYRGLYSNVEGGCLSLGKESVLPWRTALDGLGADILIVADDDSANLRRLRTESSTREALWIDRPAIGGSIARLAIAAARHHGSESIPGPIPNYLRPLDAEVRSNPDNA